MRAIAALAAILIPAAAAAQGIGIPPGAQPAQPPAPPQSMGFEPTVFCLYAGAPYSRGSRVYQGGFAMSCDAVPAVPSSLVWQPIR